jgi:ABC-type antimicrobial peptide transport system permease subunit
MRRMIVIRAGKLAAVGILLGLGGALAATHLLSGLLYDVQPSDPRTFAAISLLLAGVALLAGYVPARRASAIDPAITLRVE